jgi:hypothetical protein
MLKDECPKNFYKLEVEKLELSINHREFSPNFKLKENQKVKAKGMKKEKRK